MHGTTTSALSSACGAVVDMVGMKAALVAVLWLVGTAMSQYQSFYAGGGWAYPGPLPQFQNKDEGLDNRAGQATTTTTTQSPEQSINSHVGGWPEDRQPFWFVNRNQIQEHLGLPQPQGVPQGQGAQGQPENVPGSQTGGASTQRPPQPQPQDVPSTRPQAAGARGGPQTQPRFSSQAQDDQSQEQSQLDDDREYMRWLQTQLNASRRQRWWPQDLADSQTPDADQPQRWRGRPAVKTFPRRQ